MHAQKKRQGYEPRAAITPQTVLKNCFFALLISAGLALLLCTLATALLLKTADPGSYDDAVGIGVMYLICFLCGGIATRLSGRRVPLLCGAVSGAMLLLATLAFLPFYGKGSENAALSFGLHALLLPVCVCGALLAARQKQATRRKRRMR
ncbi:MAG: hypothetical protein E7639_02970 [Ruminococcaceae bacterium]|nr:hypothetical protein [Oscillospiraceae bacterium]